MKLMERIIATEAPAATILIRLIVGGVFFSEGIQKLLYPELRGAGRFERIGIPLYEIMGPFVGVTQIVCGALVLLGLFIRLASIPLIITMIVAIITTKIPILLGYGFWGFSLRDLPTYGFWSMAHEVRNDFTLLLGSLFFVLVGAGTFSLDKRLEKRYRGDPKMP